jgi:hypothetical protein
MCPYKVFLFFNIAILLAFFVGPDEMYVTFLMQICLYYPYLGLVNYQLSF